MIFLSLALLSAIATASGPPTGAALTEQIRASDDTFFTLFFERCDRAAAARFLTPDFEMYHDKGGKLAGGSTQFLNDYEKACTASAKPDGWRHRRTLVPASLHVEPVPGYGAIEEGDHEFYEGQGDGPKRKVGIAHFVQLWQWTPNGWQLARVFSYSHRDIVEPPSAPGKQRHDQR